jgi:uncharacterized protein YbaP (TraB family)
MLALGAGSCVQTPATPPQSAATVRTGPALFRLVSKETTMYFFGSVHLGTADFYPLPDIVEDAFQKSGNLVVELNVSAVSPMAAYVYMASMLMYKNPDALAAHISPELSAKVEKSMAEFGMSAAAYKQMKPILADMTLSSLAAKRFGFDENLGVDMHFLELAQKLQKPIYELESAEEQFGHLAAIPEDAAILSLATTIDEMPTLESQFTALISSWKTGDMDALIRESTKAYREHPGLAPVSEILIDKRNLNMANRIEALIKKGGTYFVVVGAMHLAGKGNVIEQLAGRGYTIERL